MGGGRPLSQLGLAWAAGVLDARAQVSIRVRKDGKVETRMRVSGDPKVLSGFVRATGLNQGKEYRWVDGGIRLEIKNIGQHKILWLLRPYLQSPKLVVLGDVRAALKKGRLDARQRIALVGLWNAERGVDM